MKCTDKHTGRLLFQNGHQMRIRSAVLAVAGMLFFCSCGTKTYEFEHAYDVFGTAIHYPDYENVTQDSESTESDFEPDLDADKKSEKNAAAVSYFAQDLCVGEASDTGLEETDAQNAEAAGVFHLADGTITFAKNLYKKLYPASTTKILTAYLALKYGKLTDVVTVSEKAANQASDSSVCYLHAGDQLTLEELLYGLLLKSGNDAADAIAEHISGSTKKFAKLMNKEAKALGATHSRFQNPHGLQDEKHYTCVYDLYLILNAAMEYEEFQTMIHTPKHTAVYKDANGIQASYEWETTDKFLNGLAQAPEGIRVIGGKTGTTNAAGYCLALYSKNASEEPVISIVLKADGSDSLYALMTQLLTR